MEKYRFIGGFKDTRNNGEDFALTPYLTLISVNSNGVKAIGLGLCWGYYSIYIAFGVNIPKNYPSFKILTKNK